MSTTEETVIELLKTYFSQQEAFDADAMLQAWHPNGMMYLVGNANEFRVVSIEEQAAQIRAVRQQMPDMQVKFVIDEIEQVAVHDDLIASLHVRWRMIFPEGYGRHRTFFNLANIDGVWGIVNTVDRGLQEMPEE